MGCMCALICNLHKTCVPSPLRPWSISSSSGDDTHHIHLPCGRLPAFSLKPLLITSPGPHHCFLIENVSEVLILRTVMCCSYCRHPYICVTLLWCCCSACISTFHEQMRPMLHNPALGMKWYQKQQRIRSSANVNPPPSKTFCSAAFCYELSSINPFSLVNWGAGALSFWPAGPGQCRQPASPSGVLLNCVE